MSHLRTLIAAALLSTAVPVATAHAATTDVIRQLASDAAELVAREQALVTLFDLDAIPESNDADDQLRDVDERAHTLLIELDNLGVEISPAIRSALEPLPRGPGINAPVMTEVVPPGVVYDAAIDDLLRMAATPETAAPARESDGVSFGLLIVAAISLLVLGLAAFAGALRRRGGHAELAALAWSDGLTGLANRRRLDHDLDSHRGDESRTAAIMVDVDHFKSVNDTYGHRVGDDVLRQVATMLTHHVRFDDVVYRYGGEEFCILLPDASIDDARTVARRIVEAAHNIALPDTSNITVSVGVADGAADITDVVATADRALLEAKRSGRDCAVTATAELTPN